MASLGREFPIAERFAYFNTAGVGLIPRTVVKEIGGMYERYLSTPPYEELFEEFRRNVEKARADFAPVIGARDDEISFQPNSSTALNLVVQMLDPGRGENLVADDLGFPSDVYPLLARRRHGAEVRIAKNRKGVVTPEDYSKLIDEKTRLVVLSHVSWVNGLRLDVREISRMAKARGALVMVDSTHATGYLDVDVKDWKADFLTTSNYKWLLSPVGAAEFYCSREHLGEFEPPHLGWNSSAGGSRELKVEEFQLSKTAKRFEPGNPDYVAIYGLTRSLAFMSKIGREKIRSKTLGLVEEIQEGLARLDLDVLTPTGEDQRSGVVLANSRSRPAGEIRKALEKKGVLVTDRYYHGRGGLRISPYFYNDSGDVGRLLEALGAAIG